MGKRSKIVKRLMSLIFVLILCINMFGYAAIVSDNDGSAFVTKAEFEAMKKDFSEQVTNYQNSITEKIDGAIASYLAGIRTSDTVPLDNLYAKYYITGYKDKVIYWSSATSKKITGEDTDNKQLAALNVTALTTYKDKGCMFKGTNSNESDGRAKKRYALNSSGYVESWKLWKFWLTGETSWMLTSGTGSGRIVRYICPQLTKREVKIATYTWANTTWWANETYSYSEEESEINENEGIYPLATNVSEYLVDNSITALSWSGSESLEGGYAVFGWTSQRIGRFPLYEVQSDVTDTWYPYVQGFFTRKAFSDFIFADFKSIDSGNDMISKGVVVANVTSNGNIKIKAKPSLDGWVIFYHANAVDNLWNGNRTSTTDTSWQKDANKVEKDKTFTRTLDDVKKDEKIVMLYLPSDTTKLGTINIESIIQVSE